MDIPRRSLWRWQPAARAADDRRVSSCGALPVLLLLGILKIALAPQG
ncbi:MAG: hypothetical protein M3069_05925 [Chloroflexota bacterium]|nr:hypothetical protein [Chloroflexota bacterium]